ncbi:MAG: efflux RND transporter periplasmic adaptor subunit [Thermoanaerobaculia bacterium]
MQALCVVVAILAGGCGGGAEPAAQAPPEERRTRVRAITVQPQPVTDVLELPADLAADRRAVLAAEVPGTVERVEVERGDRVAAGELLAAVDVRSLRQSAAEAEALFAQAQDEHRRARKLFESRSVTRSDLIEAETARDVAEARLESARLQLEKARVKAPWAGSVAQRRVEVGDYVVPGQPMFELVDTRTLEVRAPVPAPDAPHVEVGARVEVRLSSLPGETFTGRVVRLAPELDPSTRTLELEAEIPNSEGRLRPGMLARLQIPRRTIPDALMVPLDSLVDMEDRKVLYVVADDGTVERRDVVTGATIGDRVVVEEGLAPGDRVIVDGQSRVAPGQQVEVASP